MHVRKSQKYILNTLLNPYLKIIIIIIMIIKKTPTHKIHICLPSYLSFYLGIPATISDSIPQWSEPRRNLKYPKNQKNRIYFNLLNWRKHVNIYKHHHTAFAHFEWGSITIIYCKRRISHSLVELCKRARTMSRKHL